MLLMKNMCQCLSERDTACTQYALSIGALLSPVVRNNNTIFFSQAAKRETIEDLYHTPFAFGTLPYVCFAHSGLCRKQAKSFLLLNLRNYCPGVGVMSNARPPPAPPPPSRIGNHHHHHHQQAPSSSLL